MRLKLLLCPAIFLLIHMAAPWSSAAEKEVTFKTEDGWVISGMLGVPEGAGKRYPAVILLHAFAHDRDAFGQYLYPGLAQILGSRELATLRIDLRGRGRSMGDKELHSFSREELSRLYLDVRAALAFLETQPGIDSSRIGLLAEEESSEAAIIGWGGDRRVKAIVLVSPRLSEAAKKHIASSPDTPLFLLVSKEDRTGFRDSADAYKLTRSEHSRISVYKDLGIATTMFSVWRSERPKDKPIEDGIADWMSERLKSFGSRREVTFQSEDGWTLHGTMRTPDGVSESGPVPGVVMLHSSFTDRHIFDHLAELMVQRGLAVLNFDTRGRGKSTGKGELLDLAPDERNKTSLDVKAAVKFMASQPGVGRIGIVGPDRGAVYALAAAVGEPRVGALVLMTTLINAKDREEIARMDIPIFYVASEELEIATNNSMAAAYSATKNRGSRLMVYNGGMLGYDLFEADESLQPALAHWMKEQLSR
ncbi:MAG TPA: alpha/beta hydrolase [Blastocatellia bacterium]|nr:alpha/beta hydrolase [Blastocatellia bacterium]